jgi:hypothetical protein
MTPVERPRVWSSTTFLRATLGFTGATLLACAGERSGDGAILQRTDSAGIDVVTVESVPVEAPIQANRSVRIGSEGAAGDEHLVFEYVSDVMPLKDGAVAVIDNRGSRVGVFSASGEWSFDIGRRGSGPGEFTGPIYGSTRADTLFVWDQLERRMSLFLADGTFVESQPIPSWTSAQQFVAVDSGYVREVEWGQMHDPAPARGAIVLVDRLGVAKDTLGGPYPVPEYGFSIDEATGIGTMVNPPALTIAPPWSLHEDALFLLYPDTAFVVASTISEKSVRQVVWLPYRSEPTNAADRDAYVRGLQAEFGFPDEERESVLRATEFARARPPLAGLLVDDEGRVWLSEHDPSRRAARYVASRWIVLDVQRNAIDAVHFPEQFRLMSVAHNRAYGLTTLDSGVHVVDIFSLDACELRYMQKSESDDCQ